MNSNHSRKLSEKKSSEPDITLSEDSRIFIDSIQSPEYWTGLGKIYHTLNRWKNLGVTIIELGKSKQNKSIKAAIFGSGKKTVLLWGYPHPDEPIGAQALIYLGDYMLEHKFFLKDFTFIIIPCADPDNVNRQSWLEGDGSLYSFIRGSWRAIRIGQEVDYGFPIDYGPFYMPEDYLGQCTDFSETPDCCSDPRDCKYKGRPKKPLPESIALLKAMKMFKPDLVFSMHSNHAASNYTFLLTEEPRSLQLSLLEIVNNYGGRYLGEPVDRGARWIQKSPDLLRERRIKYFINKLKRNPKYSEKYNYAWRASAAVIVETMLSGSQFCCPESSLFPMGNFNNESPTEEKRFMYYSIEERRNGKSLVARFDYQGERIIAWQDREYKSKPEDGLYPATRGLLGIEALYKKRELLARVDAVWDEVAALDVKKNLHPYLLERETLTTPARFTGDQSMLIFRARKDYQRVATVAQEKTFSVIYPIQTLARISNFYNYLDAQPIDWARKYIDRLDDIVKPVIDSLPDEAKEEGSRALAIKSQLARVLLLVENSNSFNKNA